MANIQKVLGRHVLRERTLVRGMERIKGLHCENCRYYKYLDEPGAPEQYGCLSDINVGRCGEARLADHREQEFRLRAEQEARKHAEDYAVLQQAGVLNPDGSLDMDLERRRAE